jgi:predicted Zn-dependent protease
MLEKINLEKVFKAAARKGYVYCDVYAEESSISTVTRLGKVEQVIFSNQSGIALRCFDGKKTRHIVSHGLDTAKLLAALGDDTSAESPPTALPQSADPADLNWASSPIERIKTFCRGLAGENERAKFHSVAYQDRRTRFEVASSHGELTQGAEESAAFNVHWSVENPKGWNTFHAKHFGQDISPFVARLLASSAISEAIRNSNLADEPWPAPHGEVPVLWSARAFGKLCLHFLRAFEGDRVLGNHSFLNQLELPLDLPFSVGERVSPGTRPIDHEGSVRKPLVLFAGGRPRGLACNNWVAEQLAVESTGHARRQSYRSVPTVGLWNPTIEARSEKGPLVDKLSKGVSVHDLEVLDFNPLNANIRLRLTHAYLIHHGEEGERILPVDLKANLLELLKAATTFSSETENIGLSVEKLNQQLVTEISTPAVISYPLNLPGHVPASHYW